MLNKIGNTPLKKLDKLKAELNLKADIYAKLEYYNPAGSIKDRVALNIVNNAISKGVLKSGGVVIESTSGNTGIGLALVCKQKGYKTIITMPDTMSKERINLLKEYGAEVVLTDGSLGMQGAVEKAKELNATIENSIIADQFNNPANPHAHYKTTAVEIYNQLNGEVDAFICAIGTGGTFTGVSKYLKQNVKGVKTYGVEPESSPLISKGYAGAHKIQGIGANFVPTVLDVSLLDGVFTCSDDDAFKYAKLVKQVENLAVGISSGATLKCAVEFAKKEENANKKIVIVFPDGAERYLSVGLTK